MTASDWIRAPRKRSQALRRGRKIDLLVLGILFHYREKKDPRQSSRTYGEWDGTRLMGLDTDRWDGTRAVGLGLENRRERQVPSHLAFAMMKPQLGRAVVSLLQTTTPPGREVVGYFEIRR